MGSPLFLLRDEPELFVAFLVAVVVGITFHEFSHAAVASLLGDQTARSQGRLTLNPISHLDPLGSIAILLAGIGWGRAGAPNTPKIPHPPRWAALLAPPPPRQLRPPPVRGRPGEPRRAGLQLRPRPRRRGRGPDPLLHRRHSLRYP